MEILSPIFVMRQAETKLGIKISPSFGAREGNTRFAVTVVMVICVFGIEQILPSSRMEWQAMASSLLCLQDRSSMAVNVPHLDLDFRAAMRQEV